MELIETLQEIGQSHFAKATRDEPGLIRVNQAEQ